MSGTPTTPKYRLTIKHVRDYIANAVSFIWRTERDIGEPNHTFLRQWIKLFSVRVSKIVNVVQKLSYMTSFGQFSFLFEEWFNVVIFFFDVSAVKYEKHEGNFAERQLFHLSLNLPENSDPFYLLWENQYRIWVSFNNEFQNPQKLIGFYREARGLSVHCRSSKLVFDGINYAIIYMLIYSQSLWKL